MRTTTTNNKFQSEFSTLRDDLDRVRKDLTEMGSTLLDQGRDTFRHAGTEMQHRAEQSLHTAQNYIKARPVTSALLALGAGLVVGALWSRK